MSSHSLHIATAAFAAGVSILALASVRMPAGPDNRPAGTSQQIYGFTRARADRQRVVESRFLRIPSAARAADLHRHLTAEPHVAGSSRDRALAEWVAAEWRRYGLEQVSIIEHDVMLSYPRDVTVELVAPRAWRASMREEAIAGDPSTARQDVGVPYHAYSASGEVTAPVVYAASGNPADYEWLASHGVDVRGKIVLVRYSVPYSYRGFKALTAQQRGAAAILIYSDPADDGFVKGKTYPEGPWGPESHIQRGGIVYDFMVPGDPLTPGWPSLPGARRIPVSDAASIPHIMSAPLSARDARVILESLSGIEAPPEWRGALPIAYRVGPGPATVRLKVDLDDGVRPIWTVTGRVTGSELPQQRVIVGNHRDAWIFGGVDPSTGSTSLMELARALGALARRGVRPRRTIEMASWDAEEFTLTSSTEWGEQFADELREHAVAYLNVDSSASGRRFSAATVPSLNRLVEEGLARVRDPVTRRPLSDVADTTPSSASALPSGGGNRRINNRLGSGSDYTVFLNFLGIPVVDMTFDGPYGVYHSMYDDHEWVKRFGDPGFRYQTAMAQLWGVLALRLANADVLPLDVRAYAEAIRTFVTELGDRVRSRELETLEQAANRLYDAAAKIDIEQKQLLSEARAEAVVERCQPCDARAIDTLNRKLLKFERALLDPAGIAGRPWYRHQIYAPKFTYAAEVLPDITEAVEANNPAAIDKAMRKVAEVLNRAALLLTSER